METNNIGNSYVGMDTSMLMDMAHSKHATEQQKNAAVSQQFESVLVKQFLKEALKPMFKGVFNEEGGPTGCIVTFLLTPFPRVLQMAEGLEFLQSSSNNSIRHRCPSLLSKSRRCNHGSIS